jgi:hypothetical protein
MYVLQERMREKNNVFVNLSMFLHFTVYSTLHVWVRVNLKNLFQYLDNTSPHHRVLPPHPPPQRCKADRNHFNE